MEAAPEFQQSPEILNQIYLSTGGGTVRGTGGTQPLAGTVAARHRPALASAPRTKRRCRSPPSAVLVQALARLLMANAFALSPALSTATRWVGTSPQDWIGSISSAELRQLSSAVDRMHGGTRPIRARQRDIRWQDGMGGHGRVCDLTGHPTAARAYAWSSPIERSTKRRFGVVTVTGGGQRVGEVEPRRQPHLATGRLLRL